MVYDNRNAYTPLEQMVEQAKSRRKITIGLPAPASDRDLLFPMTPESAGMLVARGFNVKMEKGAAHRIHYSDFRYQQQGVDIVDRSEAFRCDIVIYLSGIEPLQARMLKRGSLLLTLFDSVANNSDSLAILLRSHIIALALDLIVDDLGHRPFADILAEVEGRASIALASSMLADSRYGKGILLGGVAGIVPCEVTVMGSGIDACAAARSALGLGAIVRMFDNDTYRLRSALRELGPGVAGSAMHPHVLINALRAADVVVATTINPLHFISADVVEEMKRGVVIFDLTKGAVFPSLQPVDMGEGSIEEAMAAGRRFCCVNPANAVPRTTAMALSNTFLTTISEIFDCEGLTNALMLNNGLQRAALTFLGKPVNQHIANVLGIRAVDIKLILQFS